MARELVRGEELRAFAMAFGAIIGVGWITGLGIWLAQAGAFGAALALLLGGLLILPITMCYDRLHHEIGSDGGEIGQISQVLGLVGGFCTAWTLLLAFWAVCAFEAVSVAWIAGEIFRDVAADSGDAAFHISDLQIGLIGTGLVAVCMGRGAMVGLRLQNLMTAALIGVSIFLIFQGFALGDPRNWEPRFVAPEGGSRLSGMMSIFVTAPFWFAGFNAATQVRSAGDPSRAENGGSAMLWSVVAAAAFYVLIILSASMAAPRDALLGAELPAKIAFEKTVPFDGGGTLVLVAGLLGLITTWLAVALAAIQVTLKLAALGTFGTWMKAGPRLWVANLALLTVSTAALFADRVLIYQAMYLVGICFAVVFLLVSVAALRLAPKQKQGPEPSGRGVAIVAAGSSLTVLCLSLVAPLADPNPAIGSAAVLAVVWAGVGALFYAKLRATGFGRLQDS